MADYESVVAGGIVVTGTDASKNFHTFAFNAPSSRGNQDSGDDIISAIGGTGILVAPTGTPDAIVRRLNREIDPIVRDPDYVKRLNDGGTTVNGAGTPESITKYIAEQRDLWVRIVRELKVQPE